MPGRGPLTKDEILDIWRGSVDATYRRSIEEGSGFELIEQSAVQLARVSLAIDRTTQSLYVRAHSDATNEIAMDGARSIVPLVFTRSGEVNRLLVIAAGQWVEEIAIEPGDEGGIEVRTGRRYQLLAPVYLHPGQVGTEVGFAEAERFGWGYDNPEIGSIRLLVQVGDRFENDHATIATTATTRMQTPGQADMPTPAHVGQYLRFAAGANEGKIARVELFENPDPERDYEFAGSAVTLAPELAILVSGMVGTFALGELVTVSGSGASYLVLDVWPTGSRLSLVLRQSFGSHGESIAAGATLTGTVSGATATAFQVTDDQRLVDETSDGLAGGASWAVVSWSRQALVTVTNPEQPSGGRPAMLDLQGGERGVDRSAGELADSYRARIENNGDIVSPNAIRRALSRARGSLPWSFRETGRAGLPGFFFDVDSYDTRIVFVVYPAADAPLYGPVRLQRPGGSVVYFEGEIADSVFIDSPDPDWVVAAVQVFADPAPVSFGETAVLYSVFQQVEVVVHSVTKAPSYESHRYRVILDYLAMRAYFLVELAQAGVGSFAVFYDQVYLDHDLYDGYAVGDARLNGVVRSSLEDVRAGGVSYDLVPMPNTDPVIYADGGLVLPAPFVDSVTPVGEAGGQITIQGGNYTPDADAAIDGVPVATDYVDAQTLTATAPPGTGTADVLITQASGNSGTSGDGLLVYLPPPTVDEPLPVLDTGGVIAVSGLDFTPDAKVWTDGAERPTTFFNPAYLEATVPAHAPGVVPLYVVQAFGISNVVDLTYTDSANSAIAWLEGRPAHLLQIPADHGGGAAGWPGRASAGTSAATRFALAWFAGAHNTADPAVISVGGQPWLHAAGESAMGACNTAANAARNTIDIFPGAGFVLTAAWRFDQAEAGNAGPNGYRHPLGSNSNSFGFLRRANGQACIFMLNAATASYQQLEIGAVALNTPCVLQVRYDNASGLWGGRVNKGPWITMTGATRTNWLMQFALFGYDWVLFGAAEAARCASGVIESEAYTSDTTMLDTLVEKVALASGVTL